MNAYNGSSSGGGETTSSGEDVQDSDSTGSDSGGSSRESGGLHILSDAENAEFQAARFTHLNRRRKSMSLNMRKELIDPVDPVVLGTKMPRWDDDAESLVLGFERNRVHASSSKNLIITAIAECLAWFGHSGRASLWGKGKGTRRERALVLIRESTSGRFNIISLSDEPDSCVCWQFQLVGRRKTVGLVV